MPKPPAAEHQTQAAPVKLQQVETKKAQPPAADKPPVSVTPEPKPTPAPPAADTPPKPAQSKPTTDDSPPPSSGGSIGSDKSE
jgi:hypothetical protein